MNRLGPILQVIGGVLAVIGFAVTLPSLIGGWVVPDFATNTGRWTAETLRPSLTTIAVTIPGIVLFLVGWAIAAVGRGKEPDGPQAGT